MNGYVNTLADLVVDDGKTAKLAVGAVGAGRMGRCHIENLMNTRLVEVVAICTVAPAEQKWAAEQIPTAKVYDDFDDFIRHEGLQAVVISTPTKFHRDQVISSIEHGKHVLCEKPLALNEKEAWDIYNKSLEYPQIKVACGFPRRYGTQFLDAKRRIEAGEIGEVHTIRSQTTDLYENTPAFDAYIKGSGGIFVDCIIHDIDACLYLMGGTKNPLRVYGSGTSNMYPQFADYGDADTAFGIVDFEGGKMINVYGSRNTRHGHHSMAEVIGSLGTITINREPRRLPIDISDEHGTRMEAANNHFDLLIEGFRNEVIGFRNWILFDQEPKFDLRDAALAVTIGSHLQQSFRKHCALQVYIDN